MLGANAREQGRRLAFHPVNLDNLNGGIPREPKISLHFGVPSIGAQNEVFFPFHGGGTQAVFSILDRRLYTSNSSGLLSYTLVKLTSLFVNR
jgi:hypothetical protein